MTRKEVTLSRSKFQDDWKVWKRRDIYCSLLVGVACAMRIRRLRTNTKARGRFFLRASANHRETATSYRWRMEAKFPSHILILTFLKYESHVYFMGLLM